MLGLCKGCVGGHNIRSSWCAPPWSLRDQGATILAALQSPASRARAWWLRVSCCSGPALRAVAASRHLLQQPGRQLCAGHDAHAAVQQLHRHPGALLGGEDEEPAARDCAGAGGPAWWAGSPMPSQGLCGTRATSSKATSHHQPEAGGVFDGSSWFGHSCGMLQQPAGHSLLILHKFLCGQPWTLQWQQQGGVSPYHQIAQSASCSLQRAP